MEAWVVIIVCFALNAQRFVEFSFIMKITKHLLVTAMLTACCWPVLAGQECIGINFFDPPKTYPQSYICWDGGKSYVYRGGSTTFETCDNALPVDMSEGTGSLVLESTKSGGWWC
jgi:hypothetical protein